MTYVVIALAIVGAAYVAGLSTGGNSTATRTVTTVEEVRIVPLVCIEAMDNADAVVLYSVDALDLAAAGLSAFVEGRSQAGGQKLGEVSRAMTPVVASLDDYQVSSIACREQS